MNEFQLIGAIKGIFFSFKTALTLKNECGSCYMLPFATAWDLLDGKCSVNKCHNDGNCAKDGNHVHDSPSGCVGKRSKHACQAI